MFQVKICGITNPADALATIQAGADALGLNFYEKSPRGITQEAARQILSVLPASSIKKIGVFVNMPVPAVCESFDRLRLDYIQLHGDEPPGYLAKLGGRPLIRAFRMTVEGLAPILSYLVECERLRAKPHAVLLDAHRLGQYGGTGEIADWSACAEYAGRPDLPPLILAGGLTPGNVAEAIRAVHPVAVDTASGVEVSHGRKDADAVRTFVQAAREAFTLDNSFPKT